MPILPDEARLLFHAARPDAACSETYLAALVASNPDWGLVAQLAEREKLLPVLWGYLRTHAELIPEPVRDAFRRRASSTEFRMVSTELALHKLLREFDRIGVRVMLLKGAALAATVYGSFPRRPMGDLDILVPASDAERAWEHVRGLGWTLEYENGDEFYGEFHHLAALVDPSPMKLILEIHRSMLPFGGPFTFDESALWADAVPVKLGGADAFVPSDLHQLLHLSVHFAWSHMFSGLGRTVRDVTTLVYAHPIDWDAFVALARGAGAGTCAYWTLAISRTLAGADVPESVLEALRPRQPRWVSSVLERAYISTGLLAACPSIGAAQRLWSAGIQPQAAGLGAARPWTTGERFQKVFQAGAVAPGLGVRVAGQARLGAQWWRFLTALGTSRRIV